jgi:beta-xylosidase
VIGIDKNGDGKGEPVMTYKKPNVGKTYPIETPAESDEFNGSSLGLQWEWMANPKPNWYYLNAANNSLRLYAQQIPDSAQNLWQVPNVLLQKFPAEKFMITTKINFHPNEKVENERAGLTIMGLSYSSLFLKNMKGKIFLVYGVCKNADKGNKETEKVISEVKDGLFFLRVKVNDGAECRYSYSFDGNSYTDIDEKFTVEKGRWIGAKAGIFCVGESHTNDAGFADFDWFRVEPLAK